MASAAVVAAPIAAQIVPDAVAAQAAIEIAGRWAVAPDAVRLEWGAIPAGARLDAATTVTLLGGGDDGWFVARLAPTRGSPVAVRVRGGVVDTAVVAARPLARDVELSPADLASAERIRWGPPAEAGSKPGPGWVTRRALKAGDEITIANAAPPRVVRAGDAVRVEWRRGAVAVGMDGVALNAAAAGEPVRVRLEGRRGQRSGRATADGIVRLDS